VLGVPPRRARWQRRLSGRWRVTAALGLGLVVGALLFAVAAFVLDTARTPIADAAAHRQANK